MATAEAPAQSMVKEGLDRADFDALVKAHTPRNFIGLITWQIIHRIAWVFKTESLVISSFALALGASPAMLALFPFISRIGKFLPQLIAGKLLDPRPYKRPTVLVSSILFALGWLTLGLILLIAGQKYNWTFWMFFGIYAGSWFVMGVVIVGIGTLNGKLIRPERRGSLMATSQVISAPVALGAVWVLHKFIDNENLNDVMRFGWVFLIAGILFLVATIGLLVLREPPLAAPRTDKPGMKEFFRTAKQRLSTNADYRRIVGLLFMMNMLWTNLMFYASFGKEGMGMRVFAGMVGVFLVIQTVGRSACAHFMGRLADRLGNRLVIRWLAVFLVLLPLTAAVLGPIVTAETPWLWVPVYVLVGGLIPLLPLSNNYLLEVTPVENHASCLGIANGLMVFTAFTPLAVGPLISWLGHAPVFYGFSVLMLGAVYFAFRLGEPRHRAEPAGGVPPLP